MSKRSSDDRTIAGNSAGTCTQYFASERKIVLTVDEGGYSVVTKRRKDAKRAKFSLVNFILNSSEAYCHNRVTQYLIYQGLVPPHDVKVPCVHGEDR